MGDDEAGIHPPTLRVPAFLTRGQRSNAARSHEARHASFHPFGPSGCAVHPATLRVCSCGFACPCSPQVTFTWTSVLAWALGSQDGGRDKLGRRHPGGVHHSFGISRPSLLFANESGSIPSRFKQAFPPHTVRGGIVETTECYLIKRNFPVPTQNSSYAIS